MEEKQKPLSRTYMVMPDGSIDKEVKETGNQISLRMSRDNTLMIRSIKIEDLSLEMVMKSILMAHAEFLTNFSMPEFSPELETKDSDGVVDRVSNVPGRGIKRTSEERVRYSNEGIAAAISVAAIAASGAAGVATEAATAAAAAASAVAMATKVASEVAKSVEKGSAL